mmetsp:Transcript_29141/g.93037  ORF Transcript_29141/g.93037 Transcript_29141/m.93037 type:complete len:373 (-) Transcript_29141:660-1778(-)
MKISPSIPSVSTPQCSMTRPQRSHGSGGGGGPRPLALSSALPCIPGRSSVTTARSAARAASRSSSSIVIGGARRITFSCVGFASTPLCRHPLSVSSAAGRGGRQLEARAGDGNRYSPPPPPPRTSLRAMQTSYAVTPPALAGLMTTALRRPRPRTASIRPGASPLSSSRTSMTLLPSRSARSGSLSSTTTPRAARATAEERGLPPKVLPCSPGWMQSITSLSASTALTGRAPPEMALPNMSTSGRTPSWSHASIRPVRAIPVCTSSAIMSTLCSVQSSRALLRYPGGGMTTPASPWMGSTMKAATRPPCSLSTASRAAASPKSTLNCPGRAGPKSLVALGSQLMATAPSVRPWKHPQQLTMRACPLSIPFLK